MSGKPWTPERRFAFAAKMRARWRGGAYRRRRAPVISAAERAARSARMARLNARMGGDKALKRKCVNGQKRARRSPAYRAIQSAVMADVMSRPELRAKARDRCIKINTNPKVRVRQWAGRRGFVIPAELQADYRLLVRKVGSAEARRIIKDEIARTKRRRGLPWRKPPGEPA